MKVSEAQLLLRRVITVGNKLLLKLIEAQCEQAQNTPTSLSNERE